MKLPKIKVISKKGIDESIRKQNNVKNYYKNYKIVNFVFSIESCYNTKVGTIAIIVYKLVEGKLKGYMSRQRKVLTISV